MEYELKFTSHQKVKKIVIECNDVNLLLKVLHEDEEVPEAYIYLHDYEARLLGNLLIDLARHVENNKPLYYE